ncbi:MAG: malate synthase A [Gammaproteobacteria bacterium]
MTTRISHLSFTEPLLESHLEILTPEACELLAKTIEKFQPGLEALLRQRQQRQERFDAGELPDFLPETRAIRKSDWTIADIPHDLRDRRVEITGPVDRKMIINALNANVKVFMADFEDSLSPSWNNIIEGQINLRDANNRSITFKAPKTEKLYQLNPDPATLICRIRGLHLQEKHILCQDAPVAGCLVDFVLYLFHNHRTLNNRNTGPYFYIPKLQSHLEARWWNEVIVYVQQQLGLDTGTVRVTCLIETLPAVFEMHEILYELKEHIVALNCGRWDYIFSYIKTLRAHPDRVLPDRQAVTMDQPFLNAYSRLLIHTCHKRGALAMGGMAAFIPSKDPDANTQVLARVESDKRLEARTGHDGTWIAHPGLAEIAQNVFAEYLGTAPNQLSITRDNDQIITAAELLQPCEGPCTEAGLRLNIRIALQYVEAWISGTGCVPIYGLMEDAATAEISRASIWQWIQTKRALDTGKIMTADLFHSVLEEELQTIRTEIGSERYEAGKFKQAATLFADITTADSLVDFLTQPGYQLL